MECGAVNAAPAPVAMDRPVLSEVGDEGQFGGGEYARAGVADCDDAVHRGVRVVSG